MKEAYIYTYVNKETKKTYIGARCAYKGSCYDDFNIKYFSSSKDKEFRKDMADGKLEGQIVLVMKDDNADKKIFEVEAKMIKAYWDKYGKENSYNHYAAGKFNTAGVHTNVSRHHSDETRKKMSETHKGKKPWNKGKPLSDETRKKLSIAFSGEKNPFYGKHLSNDAKAKLKIKYKWITTDGEIKMMNARNVKQWHPDWKLIEK